MKDALSARLVAHYLGTEEGFPAPARAALEAAGIRVLSAQDRSALRKLAAVVPPDVLILSAQAAPRPARGLSALRRLYGRELAVVVLIPDGDEAASAGAMAAGAEDALPAATDPVLFAARLEAAVRTVEQSSALPSRRRGTLRTPDGEIVLDARAHVCLVRDGAGYREVLLTGRQSQALEALLRAGGGAVEWGGLRRRGWAARKLGARSRTLVQHVLVLRRKLGRAGRRIQALPGVGYRLV